MTDKKARNGAAMLLDLFEADEIDCVFASPIAVMAPIWEELAKRSNSLRLRYFRCRHEILAVAAAHGYYQVTGRPQVVFLPTNLGVQNGSLALRSAMVRPFGPSEIWLGSAQPATVSATRTDASVTMCRFFFIAP